MVVPLYPDADTVCVIVENLHLKASQKPGHFPRVHLLAGTGVEQGQMELEDISHCSTVAFFVTHLLGQLAQFFGYQKQIRCGSKSWGLVLTGLTCPISSAI